MTTEVFSPDTAVRVKLPNDRGSFIVKYEYYAEDGVHKGHIVVGLYDDGSPGELFIFTERMGSRVRGLLDAWAITASIALQCGVPLDMLLAKVARTNFPPQGRSKDPEIGYCSSPMDAVARTLAKVFEIDLDNPRKVDEEELEDEDK